MIKCGKIIQQKKVNQLNKTKGQDAFSNVTITTANC